jgi:DNA-binding MurR/RpiR family transcriptional regulator
MLPSAHPLSERIKRAYATLTPGQQRVVRLLIDAPHEAAFLSAAELGRRAEVSDSTVVRLPSALGYSSYPELRQQLQNSLLAQRRPDQLLDERLRGEPGPHPTIQLEIENLQALDGLLTAELVEEAVGLILGARQLFVIGFRSGFGLAHACAHMLQQTRENVELITLLGGRLPDELAGMSRHDVLIAFSTPRYSRQIAHIVDYAAGIDCKVIVVTDSVLAPLARHAALVIQVPIRSTSFFPSNIAALTAIHVLASEVARRRPTAVTGRLQQLDRVANEFGVLMTEGDEQPEGNR